MKYINTEHKKTYNILKKQKDKYDYMELYNLIKKSRIIFSSDVTHKKTLEYFLINEADEKLILKLKNDKLLNLMGDKLSLWQYLKDENINRIQFFKEQDIAYLHNFSYINKLFESDDIIKRNLLDLFKENVLHPTHLEINQYNYNLSHNNSPIDSLEKIKILEQCGYFFEPKDFYYLSKYITEEECNKIIDYFSKKIDFNLCFQHADCIYYENYDDEKIGKNLETNILGIFLLKNPTHPFFISLLNHKYNVFLPKDTHQHNFIEFKNVISFLMENPNYIFDNNHEVSSLSIMLSQINNNIIKEQAYFIISNFIQLIDTSNIENGLSFKSLINTNNEILSFIFLPKPAHSSIFRILNKDNDELQIIALKSKIYELFDKNSSLFDDFLTFSFNYNTIKNIKNLKYFFYTLNNIFTDPRIGYYLFREKNIDLNHNTDLSHIISLSNSSNKEKIQFLFNCSNIDYDLFSFKKEIRDNILKKITEILYDFYSKNNINMNDTINNFQLNNEPAKWKNPEDSLHLLNLKNLLIKNETSPSQKIPAKRL